MHNASVGFSLKKHGTPSADVKTPLSSNATANIRIIYGSAIAKYVSPSGLVYHPIPLFMEKHSIDCCL